MAASIDVATGLVSTAAVDKRFHRYILHPLMGNRLLEYRYPLERNTLIYRKRFSSLSQMLLYRLGRGGDRRGPLIEANGRAQVGAAATRPDREVAHLQKGHEKV